MTNQELQQEELEVLNSIYEGDDHFKAISPVVFQYKVGEDQDVKSFLVEVSWSPEYPESAPSINLDTFYNKQIHVEVKANIVAKLMEQVEQCLGAAMTYTIFEFAKENAEDMMAHQPAVQVARPRDESPESDAVAKSKEKKEHLTKAQKRKLGGRQDVKGEMPRGWNWVDVVKHLSQTGRADPPGDS